MKKLLSLILIFQMTIYQPQAKAMFGADAAIMMPTLLQQLLQMIKTYMELKQIYDKAKETYSLLKKVNEGIDGVIKVMELIPLDNDNVLGELKQFRQAVQEIERIYGAIPKSMAERMHLIHDESIAESIKLANLSKDYASKQESNAAKALDQSGSASPKGAARLSVQVQAEILHTMNQILRTNAQMLKIQSEQLGIENKNDKDQTSHFNKVNSDLKDIYHRKSKPIQLYNLTKE